MKHLIRTAILVAVFLGFYGLGAYAEETVINKDGKPVLLMDDHTWKIIDTSGDDGKVIFKITEAVDTIEVLAKKNDMDEFSHWKVFSGCKYTLTADNNTDFKIKVNHFYLKSTQTDIFTGSGNRGFIQWGNIIEPGKSYTDKGDYGIAEIYKIIEGKPKKQPSQERKTELSEKYGCKSQSGSIYLRSKPKFVVFSKNAGISDSAIKLFVKGSPNGIYPLREKIEF
jgi:hypothetical protein